MLPRVYGVIDRPRVLDKLESARHTRVTIVSAPPGFGKTTAVSQFVSTLDSPVAWHSIHAEEHDIANLYTEALNALSFISPTIKAVLPRPYGYSAPELALQIASHLTEDPILQKDDFFYVLDDLHLVDSQSTTIWLDTLVRRFPQNGHLILISRTRPPISYMELASRNQITACNQADLQMTHPEIEYMIQSQEAGMEADTLQKLDGWPAGIALAVRQQSEAVLLEETPDELFRHLSVSLLSAQTPELRDFLLASSTFEVMTPESLELLAIENAYTHLERVQSLNLFLTRIGDGWSYHKLFRDFLQGSLKDEDPVRWHKLHIKAGSWLESGDRIEPAMIQYSIAGAFEEMARLSERVATDFYRTGKFDTLLDWDELLTQVGHNPPWLTYTCAQILTDRHQFSAARVKYAFAEKIFESREEWDNVANIHLKYSWIDIRSGKSAEALEAAAVYLDHPDNTVRGNALRITGLVYLDQNNMAESLAALEEALPLYREPELFPALSHLLEDLHLAYNRIGDLEKAGAVLHEVIPLRRRAGGQAALASALNNLGYHYHQLSDYKGALATLREGTSIAARTFDPRQECYLLWSLADVLRDTGLFAEAESAYNAALNLITSSLEPSLRANVLINKATLHHWRGEFEESLELAEEALEQTKKLPMEWLQAYAISDYSRAALGDIEPWDSDLLDRLSNLNLKNAPADYARILGIVSATYLLLGDEAIASACLTEAESLLEEMGSPQLLAAEIVWNHQLSTFVDAVSPEGKLGDAIRRLENAKAELSAESRPSSPEEQLVYLRVKIFGPESVEFNEKIVPHNAWKSTHARDLFFRLLFAPRTREEVGIDFWPDASPAKIRTNFHTVLGKLRNAISREVVIFKDENYILNPDVPVECDAFEFDRLITNASDLPATDPRAEELWRKAVELYQGELLPSIGSEWTILPRENYSKLAWNARLRLGECILARKAYQEAITVYSEAVVIDPISEEPYRGIMRAQAGLGEKGKVSETFQLLCDTLHEELGIAPSNTTRKLASDLLD